MGKFNDPSPYSQSLYVGAPVRVTKKFNGPTAFVVGAEAVVIDLLRSDGWVRVSLSDGTVGDLRPGEFEQYTPTRRMEWPASIPSATRPGLPTDAAERKAVPLATGLLDYFPDALAEVARVSQAGSKQHHPDEPLHWDRAKSPDEADALLRHLVDRGKFDTDGQLHSAKVAWRALAMLQRELELHG